MPIVHRSRGPRRLLTATTAVAAAITAGVVAAAPVGAHPFGPPLSARLDVDGAEVVVTWTAAEDDWVNLGEHLDAFTTQTDENGTQLTGAELLARSDNLPSYLLSHIVIEQDGRPCEGQVTQLQDLLTLGAQLRYTCPRPVDTVELTVTTLTDINENYRTVVTSDDASEPAQALFTATTPTQRWSFDATSGADRARGALMTAGGLILAALAGGLVWWRRGSGQRPNSSDTATAAETVEATR